jgi:hypothetical protein
MACYLKKTTVWITSDLQEKKVLFRQYKELKEIICSGLFLSDSELEYYIGGQLVYKDYELYLTRQNQKLIIKDVASTVQKLWKLLKKELVRA